MSVFNGGKRNIVLGYALRPATSSCSAAGATSGPRNWPPATTTAVLTASTSSTWLTSCTSSPWARARALSRTSASPAPADDGGSNVDNDAFGALFTYRHGGHGVTAGYQYLSGDTGFAYIAGSDNALVNLIQINDFGNQDERSWQARYDFDFATVGVPGLTFMTRYLSGDNVDRGVGMSEGKTWERNTDIAYVVQSGPLKNVGLRLRNATTRSNFGSDLDENRFIVSYSLPLW